MQMADDYATKPEESQGHETVSMEALDTMVKGFLATRYQTAFGGVDVVFDQASVEGLGKGVGCPQ